MTAEETACRLVAQALQCEPDAVGIKDDIGTLEGWTSLAHMRLMLEIEATIGRMLAPEIFVELTSVASVAEILRQEGN